MTNYNRIPTVSPWWHLSVEDVQSICGGALSGLFMFVAIVVVFV